MADHELWSFTNALLFIIFLILSAFGLIYGLSAFTQLDKIKEDWPNQRCSPMIMPFASYFGHDAKENFEFCMGKIFSTHSQSYLGSITGIFGQFSSILTSMFNSMNSMRNTIASLGGGINVIFQEFTERISMFFFKLRMTSIYMKSLFMRMYALLFSVMYMGMSGISGMTSFTNTFLFSFLDTFCFPEETPIIVEGKGSIPIKDVRIGDILLPGRSKVTATFEFEARGQPMVQLGSVVVSTNHYVMYNGHAIKAGNHPDAIQLGPWKSEKHLFCLNTHDHHIPVSILTFMDYDETSAADHQTMHWMEQRLNGHIPNDPPSPVIKRAFREYGFAVKETTGIKMKDGSLRVAKDVRVGDEISTNATIAGIIRKQITQRVQTSSGLWMTPSTLTWESVSSQWKRVGDYHLVESCEEEYISFVVIPHSQIELEDGTIVRDYMEICSPDSEMYYAKHLESLSS